MRVDDIPEIIWLTTSGKILVVGLGKEIFLNE